MNEHYRILRQKILTLDPIKEGFAPSANNPVWGLMMETAYPNAVVTLVVIKDDTVSLYFSNGGGILGAGEHQGPRKAGNALLNVAPRFLSHVQHTTEFPLPKAGHTRFYFLTFKGIFTVEQVENDLGNNRLALSPLFHEAHEVISQIRLVDEQMKLLIAAAAAGKRKDVEKLIKSNVNVNGKDASGLTPLMAAAHQGKTDIVKVLIEAGANLEDKDKDAYTALMFACNAGNTDCVKLLIKHGANVHAREKTESTALMFAAQHGHDDIVKLLLAQGADPNFKGRHGLSAIGFAQQNGLPKTEKLLREKK